MERPHVLIAIGIFIVANILCLAGLGSPVWAVNSSGNQSRGLWEACSFSDGRAHDCYPPHKIYSGNESGILFYNCTASKCVYPSTSSDLEALRIVLTIGIACAVISVILAIIWAVGRKCTDSYSWRTFVLGFSAISTLITAMTTLGFGLKIIVGDPLASLHWGFGVSFAGALLMAIGNFFLCQHAHTIDDEDRQFYEKEHPRNENNEVHSSYM